MHTHWGKPGLLPSSRTCDSCATRPEQPPCCSARAWLTVALAAELATLQGAVEDPGCQATHGHAQRTPWVTACGQQKPGPPSWQPCGGGGGCPGPAAPDLHSDGVTHPPGQECCRSQPQTILQGMEGLACVQRAARPNSFPCDERSQSHAHRCC